MINIFTFYILFIIAYLIQWNNSLFLSKKPFYKIENDSKQVSLVQNKYISVLPWMNLRNQIKFRLWTRNNPHLAQQLIHNDYALLKASNFNSSQSTKIIVHGYAHSANELYFEHWLIQIRDSYLQAGNYNIIIVDYTLFALPQFYWMPGPKLVSEELAKLIQFLDETQMIKLSELHIIGYSWGAHIAGNAGSKLKGEVGRITGLDPANPLHRYVSDDMRLDKSDAKFVDVIHTNSGGGFGQGFLGLDYPLAHIDFYPNSGKSQPGCPKRWIYIYETIECDHIRSVMLFIESILSPKSFPSCKCESWDDYVRGSCFCNEKNTTFMGESVEPSANGTYYLFTRNKSPFGLGSQENFKL